jgi:hypothetical protein
MQVSDSENANSASAIAASVSNSNGKLSVKDLYKIESRLNHGFAAAVIALLLYLGISIFFSPLARDPDRLFVYLLIAGLVALLALCGYIWYIVSMYITARAIRKPAGLYLFWAIGGPILSLLPIPIVSIALAAAPLVIKFILSGEIQSMIRTQTSRSLL